MLIDYDSIQDILFVINDEISDYVSELHICSDVRYLLQKGPDKETIKLQINNISVMSPGEWWGGEVRHEIPTNFLDAADRWISTCIAVQEIFAETLEIADLVEKEDAVEDKNKEK